MLDVVQPLLRLIITILKQMKITFSNDNHLLISSHVFSFIHLFFRFSALLAFMAERPEKFRLPQHCFVSPFSNVVFLNTLSILNFKPMSAMHGLVYFS